MGTLRPVTTRGLNRCATAGVFSGALAEKYGNFTGASGTYFSTPDAAANRFSTSIEIIVRARTAWSAATNQAFMAKYGAGGAVSWSFRKATTGTLALTLSSDGTNDVTATSSAAVGFVDNFPGWVRVLWNTSDDVTQFFTAPGGSVKPTAWTQLGTNQTLTLGNIFNSAAVVSVGARGNAGGLGMFIGQIYYAGASGTVGGPAAVSFEPVRFTGGFVSTTGETWTANGAATIQAGPL